MTGARSYLYSRHKGMVGLREVTSQRKDGRQEGEVGGNNTEEQVREDQGLN